MPAVALAHGMFAWTDLIAHDPADAKDFYGALFGWQPTALPGQPASAYTLFTVNGQRVAGLTQMSETTKGQGVLPMWMSYILVDDIDAVVHRVESLGGSVQLPPMDIEDSGRMSMVVDPAGGSVCLWQAGTHGGAECFNDPGCMSWNELLTRDPDAAAEFYAELLGWTYQVMDLGEQGIYQVCMVGGRPNGGIMAMPEAVPDHVPPHWDVYFTVEDVDTAAARATGLGGQIVVPPTDISVGRFSYLTDRQGGHFTIFRPSET
jgi:predicted enzyme related to lactoylglutathione lyase